jgi:hypothetical protein
MTKLWLFFGLSVCALGQVTSVSAVDQISYSSWRMKLAVSGGNYDAARFYYSVAPLSCTTVTGGVLIESIPYSVGIHDSGGNYVYMDTAGKVPNTLYNVCVQTRTSGSWTSAPMIQVKTLPAPKLGYRVPPRAIKVDTSYPSDINDGSFTTTVTVTPDCSSFLAEFNAAIARQQTRNTIINLPLTTCQGTVYFDQTPVDVKTPRGTDVQGDGSLTVTGHGWSDNQAVIVARSGDYAGNTPIGIIRIQGDNPPGSERPDGRMYYVRRKDANNIFLCAKPPSQGGTNIVLSSGGTGTFFLAAWPRPLKWIIIRTPTPDDQFVPVGVSVGAMGGMAWLPKMARFTNSINNHAKGALPTIGFIDSSGDGRRQSMLANIRFVGIAWTVPDDPKSNTTIDPPVWDAAMRLQSTQQNIYLDRCIFMTPSMHQRVFTELVFQGAYNAVIHSYFDKTINYFFPENEGGIQ